MNARARNIAHLLFRLGDSIADDLTRHASNLAHQHGLSSAEFSFVCEVGYRGSMTVSDVARHTALSLGAASGLVERLVQRGFVERQENPANRRSKNVKLTEAGRALSQEFDKLYLAYLERAVEGLPGATREGFEHVLEEVVAHTAPNLDKQGA